jgi:hypothetical protein
MGTFVDHVPTDLLMPGFSVAVRASIATAPRVPPHTT